MLLLLGVAIVKPASPNVFVAGTVKPVIVGITLITVNNAVVVPAK